MKKLNIKLKTFKKKKNIKIILLISILLIILLKNTDFFKSSYYVLNKDYELRLQENAYDFCNQTGTGYVFKIKNKFNLKKTPLIKNFNTAPSQYWVFKNFKKFDKEKLIILFNTDENGKSRFDFSDYEILDNYKNNCLFLKKND